MAKYKHEWRELEHREKKQYAIARRRLDLGTMGYQLSTLRAIHLTTKEGNDNTTKTFARHLRKLFTEFRAEGYDIQYDGTLGYTPGKHLLHWHGIIRIKGGYFLCAIEETEKRGRRILGDKWDRIHGAFVVKITAINTFKDLDEYILKHVLSDYVGEEEGIRNRFLFSREWMRTGWKEAQGIAKGWVLGGLSPMYMTKERWDKVNEVLKAWAEKRTVSFFGKKIVGRKTEYTGYLWMDEGRIVEATGGAFEEGNYEYYDY